MSSQDETQKMIHMLPIRQQELIAELYINTAIEIKRLSDKGEETRAKELLSSLEGLSEKIQETTTGKEENINTSIKKLQELLIKLNPSWEGEN
jgi:ABC-type transporter Mla subunit MlaD